MPLWTLDKKPTFADGEAGEQNSAVNTHGWIDPNSSGNPNEILVAIRDFIDKRRDFFDDQDANLDLEDGLWAFLLEDSTEETPAFILLE